MQLEYPLYHCRGNPVLLHTQKVVSAFAVCAIIHSCVMTVNLELIEMNEDAGLIMRFYVYYY